MVNDAKFDIVSVTKTLYATNIEAESITLHDTTLRGNVHTSGRRVKELYESQKDTNCFDDKHKTTVERLEKVTSSAGKDCVTLHRCYVALEHHGSIDDESMPNNSCILCLDDMRRPMYKNKIDGCISYSSLTTAEPHINISLGNIMSLSASAQ